MTTELTPAGWYPDPNGNPGQKYWDGQTWHDASPGANPSAVPAVQSRGGAPSGVDAYGRPLSDKSKLVAGLLQIFLSIFAVGRFYLGYTNIALIQIAVTVVTCGIGAWWPIIDGIMIIMGKVPDPQGRTLRD
jgi:TM2 domain-containing membrane protein YozV